MASSKQVWPGDKPTGKKRSFWVTVSRSVKLTLDESVLAQGMAPDGPIWKNPTEDMVVEHLAFNMVANRLLLNDIDGFANCPATSAEVSGGHQDWDVEIVSRGDGG